MLVKIKRYTVIIVRNFQSSQWNPISVQSGHARYCIIDENIVKNIRAIFWVDSGTVMKFMSKITREGASVLKMTHSWQGRIILVIVHNGPKKQPKKIWMAPKSSHNVFTNDMPTVYLSMLSIIDSQPGHTSKSCRNWGFVLKWLCRVVK